MWRIVALSIAILLLAACESSPAPPPTAVPVPSPSLPTSPPSVTVTPTIPPPRSNITRADYNAALAKWQQQGITDYEISVYELSLNLTNGGVYRLRVQGDQLTVLSNPYLFRDTRAATPTPYPAADADRFNTVAGLFADIDRELISVEQGKMAGGQVLPFVYQVRFDPVLGYPTAIDTKCEEPTTLGSMICPSDTFVRRNVPSLIVLARTPVTTPTKRP